MTATTVPDDVTTVPDDQLYTVKEVCDRLRISRTTLYKLFEMKELDQVKILRGTYARAKQVEYLSIHGTGHQSAA